MPDFTVDINGLGAMQSNLSRAKDNVGGALKAMADIGPDSIGPDDLDDACAEFRDDWQQGIKKMGDALDKLAEGLKGTRHDYAEAEKAITDGFTKMQQHVQSGQPGGGPAR